MEVTKSEIEIIKTLVDHAKQDGKSYDDLMWFLHSNTVKIALQQVMSRDDWSN